MPTTQVIMNNIINDSSLKYKKNFEKIEMKT